VTPYADFSYFLLLLYPLVALIALGTLGRLGRAGVLIVSLLMILFQYGDALRGVVPSVGLGQLVFLAAYAGGSTAIVLAYGVARRRGPALGVFRLALGFALLPLVAVKVYPLVATGAGAPPANAGHAAASAESLVTAGFLDTFGFLGISYMALRVVDVLVALRDSVLTESPRATDVLSYLLFVPTISAGPIDRFPRFLKDLRALPKPARDYAADVEAGIHRLAQGFLYKFIVATLIDRVALRPLAVRTGVLATTGYMYAFSLYLFFDFAGYSAFAIGTGRFFGVRVPENFDAPFRSRSFREMWNRWHVSLSWWLRDHVYMRFMLHAARRRWFRGDRVTAHRLGLLLTMGLMGAWHGLAPQYLVYGLYQGTMLVLYDVAERWNARRHLVGDGALARAASVFVTVNLFCFGLLIFSGRLFPAR
jgi:membrane protein involved in D-alanine export